jgi:large repetitive protein
MALLLLGFVLLLAGVRPAHAQGSSVPCLAGFGGIINGNVMPVPNNVGIDGRCTIENYQDAANSPNGVASPNGDYTGNITLLSTSDLLILSNVDFDGNISCEVGSSHPTVFYLLNSEVDAHQLQCMRKIGTVAQIDKIGKSIPSGQTTAAIGVPFTYALTFPQQCAPPTPTSSCPSVNTNGSTDVISQVTITDDLNATGVSLTYLSSVATWKGSTCPAPGAPVPFTGPAPNSTGLLTFSGFPTIPAGCQVVLNVTVVLNNTVPPNSPGTTFVNTANWTLGTTLGGTFFFPLPGMQGVSPPLTIATPPTLTLTKGGPPTMNLGQLGQFSLNVQNTGTTDAWNATIVDKLPTGATGGMCATAPQILSAQVFQADGVTPVPGKGPLTAGTDYTLSWAGAPACTLTLNLLSAAAVIGPTQRLIVTYQTQLDPNTQNGATLTNVAGATQWYSGPSTVPTRQSYTCTLTNGTPGVLDCQDAHTVTVAISAVTITKQVTVVGGGPPIAGATLQYLVHVTNTSASPVTPVVITDDLNAAGPGALTYVAGTATMNGSPNGVSVAGNVITATYPGPLAAGGTIDLSFRATLGSTLAAGTIVTNTGVVTWGNPPKSASGSVSIQVVAPTPPALTLVKGGPATLYLGQLGQFSLNVQNTGQTDAWNATIVDKLPTGATGGMCTATPQILSAQVFQADGVTPVPGKGPLVAGTDYTVTYAGAPACTLTINLLSAAAVISPTQRLIVTYRTQLDSNTQKGATLTNVAGAIQWYSGPSSSTTRQSYTCPLTNGTPGVLDCQDAHTVTVPISAVTLTKGGPATMYLGQLGQFTLNVQNTGTADAWNATLVDKLPTGATGGMCTTTPQILSAQVFQADGVTPAPGKGSLAAGTDYTVTWAGAPACTLTINLLSAAAVISPTQRLNIVYQTQLDANTQMGATLTNVAGATQWYSGPSSDSTRQSSTCTLTNGTPGALDCQDAHTVTVTSATVSITKQVTVVGGGAPAPGSSLEYLVHVTNNSPNPVSPVAITDDLNAAGPGALTYVTGTATMNGSVTGVTVTGNVITANYSATYGPLAPGGTIDLRFRATLGNALATGTTVTNTGVVTWGNPAQSASASVSVQLDTPPGALTVGKTTPLVEVTRGQLIPYTITVTNVLAGVVTGVALVDSFPAGFRYVPGSARLDGVPAEPTLSGFQLTWSNLSFAAGAHHTVVLLLAVGAGVGEGQFVNRAQAFSQVTAAAANRVQTTAAVTRAAVGRAPTPAPAAVVVGSAVSSEASATVVVVPDTTFDCTDVIGKVFDDKNGNGHQDPGEPGLPSVRVLTTRGLAAVTDEFGRFHITCAITPLEGRGSNFALKLDDRTLPSGYRLTTPEFVVERATRGKALRFEFGASIHRVVSLDISDAVFEPGTADMRPQWQSRLDLLLAELRKGRSVLRLSYVADVEDAPLVDERLEAVARTIRDDWRAHNPGYELTIEREVFWLRGGPPKEPVERLRGGK